MDWSTCSPDIILLIFKFLDHKSLVNCLSVCKLWRDVVDYIGKVNDLWPNLAQNAMYNKGITFKQRSILPWRELYFNSVLWNNGNVYLQLDKILDMDHLKDIHIFEDNIIVILDSVMKHYKVDTLIQILETNYVVDYQQTPHITAKLLAGNLLFLTFGKRQKVFRTSSHMFKLIDNYCFVIDGQNVLSLIKCCKNIPHNISTKVKTAIMKLYNALGPIYSVNIYNDEIYVLKLNRNIIDDMDSLDWFRLVHDRCFVLDSQNVLSLIKRRGNDLFKSTIMRSYESVGSICGINIYNDEIYVLKQNGNIIRADDWQFVGKTIGKINSPNFYNSPSVLHIFLKHSVVYSVCSVNGSKSMEISKIGDTGEIVVESSGLTCATSHGDILFLGYEDGEVSVYLPKKMLSSRKPQFTFNIKDIANCNLKDSAVKAIEVYEANESHYLFIATRYELIKVIVTHNNE